MRTNLIVLLALGAIAVTTGLAAAQPPPPPGPPGGPPPDVGESRELIEQVMITRLSRRLELTDEQSLLLLRRFNEVREQQQQIRQARQRVMHELRNVLKEEKDEVALKNLMQQLDNLDKKSTDLNQEVRRSVSALDLNVWQQAKLRLFLTDFEGEMRRVVQQVQGGRPMMGDPDRPGGPRGPMMGDPDRPGGPRGPMMNDPDKPRPRREPGDAMRRPREGRAAGGEGGQRQQRMQDRPRRAGAGAAPPPPPAE